VTGPPAVGDAASRRGRLLRPGDAASGTRHARAGPGWPHPTCKCVVVLGDPAGRARTCPCTLGAYGGEVATSATWPRAADNHKSGPRPRFSRPATVFSAWWTCCRRRARPAIVDGHRNPDLPRWRPRGTARRPSVRSLTAEWAATAARSRPFARQCRNHMGPRHLHSNG